jgi:hypothetical protein
VPAGAFTCPSNLTSHTLNNAIYNYDCFLVSTDDYKVTETTMWKLQHNFPNWMPAGPALWGDVVVDTNNGSGSGLYEYATNHWDPGKQAPLGGNVACADGSVTWYPYRAVSGAWLPETYCPHSGSKTWSNNAGRPTSACLFGIVGSSAPAGYTGSTDGLLDKFSDSPTSSPSYNNIWVGGGWNYSSQVLQSRSSP